MTSHLTGPHTGCTAHDGRLRKGAGWVGGCEKGRTGGSSALERYDLGLLKIERKGVLTK